jgi:hypothetical protein
VTLSAIPVPMEVSEIMRSNTPTLRMLLTKQKEVDGVDGVFIVHNILKYILADIASFLNVGKNFRNDQLDETADLILSDPKYIDLKIEDFKKWGNNFKKGRYGQTFDRFDGQVAFLTLDMYLEARNEQMRVLRNKIAQEEIKASKQKLEVKMGYITTLRQNVEKIVHRERVKELNDRAGEKKEMSADDRYIHQMYENFPEKRKFQRSIALNSPSVRRDQWDQFVYYKGKFVNRHQYVDLKFKRKKYMEQKTDFKIISTGYLNEKLRITPTQAEILKHAIGCSECRQDKITEYIQSLSYTRNKYVSKGNPHLDDLVQMGLMQASKPIKAYENDRVYKVTAKGLEIILKLV